MRKANRKFDVTKFRVKDGRLNLGCGDKLREGWINIDKMFGKKGVTCVDLEKGSLPFGDDTCVEISAEHAMEHLHNFIPIMNECHRVLKRKGTLTIIVPVLPHMEAFQDPTHVRFFTPNSFGYFHETDFLYKNVGKNYGIKPFRMLKLSKNGFELKAELTK